MSEEEISRMMKMDSMPPGSYSKKEKHPFLTSQELVFCREYLVDGNGTRAAICAGYPRAGASTRAHENLQRDDIRDYIETLRAKVFKRLDLSAERVLFELCNVAFANLQDYTSLDEDGLPKIDLRNLTRQQWAAISEFTEDATGGINDGERRMVLRRKIKLGDKPKALEMLAKHFSLLTEKHEHSFSDDLIAKLNEGRQRVLEHK